MTFTRKLWDRREPINGADPDAVLSGFPGIPDDSPIVLVLDGDAVTQVQATDPAQPGWSWWPNDAAAQSWGDGVVEGLNNPPPPPEPGEEPEPPPAPQEPPAPPTAEEVAQLRADLDWLMLFVTTGEA